ncbi:uncharacterized protein [Miscanthus floridulus]|uniref:uncharacterized protein n=1 Tax=Miscanthus floridulus TaxID=154761 RepID=UPI0034578270
MQHLMIQTNCFRQVPEMQVRRITLQSCRTRRWIKVWSTTKRFKTCHNCPEMQFLVPSITQCCRNNRQVPEIISKLLQLCHHLREMQFSCLQKRILCPMDHWI